MFFNDDPTKAGIIIVAVLAALAWFAFLMYLIGVLAGRFAL